MSAVIDRPANLTPKERIFVEAYVGKANLNGAAAARIAGYKDGAGIYVAAYQLLRKPHIKDAIEAHLARVAMDSNEILTRLTRHARADVGDLLDDDGSFDFETARERGLTDLIKEIEVTERWIPNGNQPAVEKERKVKLKTHDQQAALVHMGKFRKLFTERVEVDAVVLVAVEDRRDALAAAFFAQQRELAGKCSGESELNAVDCVEGEFEDVPSEQPAE